MRIGCNRCRLRKWDGYRPGGSSSSGDKDAYALVAAEIADRFLAVARRILRDRDLAEDATQQALLAVWQDLPRLRDQDRFESWSYRVLVNACHAEARKERRWSPNVGGRPAQLVVLTIGKGLDCEPHDAWLWYDESTGGASGGWRWAEALGATYRIWIIDVGGPLVWINTSTFKDADAGLAQDIHDVIESIEFE